MKNIEKKLDKNCRVRYSKNIEEVFGT